MLPRYDYGHAVRVVRHIRNDGTFPGIATGTLLVRRGSVGFVRNVGTFLQDQVIYEVHFLDQGRVVGCREEELIDADEEWIDSRFDTRDKVTTSHALAVGGEVVVPAGSEGQVMRVIRDPQQVQYHVLFGSRIFSVPESSLSAVDTAESEA